MAIAEFPVAPNCSYQHIQNWIADHGVAVMLAGCLMFWSVVASALYVAL